MFFLLPDEYAVVMALYLTLSFIVGSAIGSFLNVVIDRSTRGESLGGRSYCDHCRATLGTLDLVPIISFVTLGAKCRYCKKPLSWQYPLVETITASLFLLAVYILAANGALDVKTLAFWLYLTSTMIVVAVVDFKFQLIPTTIVFAASLIALVYNYFTLSSSLFIDCVLAAFGAALFFLAIVVFTRGRGMGQGDIVLGFLIGIVLGIKATVLSLFLAFFSGALVSLLLIALGRKKFGQTVPFAPFLVLGFLASLFFSKQILDWYLGMLY